MCVKGQPFVIMLSTHTTFQAFSKFPCCIQVFSQIKLVWLLPKTPENMKTILGRELPDLLETQIVKVQMGSSDFLSRLMG